MRLCGGQRLVPLSSLSISHIIESRCSDLNSELTDAAHLSHLALGIPSLLFVPWDDRHVLSSTWVLVTCTPVHKTPILLVSLFFVPTCPH